MFATILVCGTGLTSVSEIDLEPVHAIRLDVSVGSFPVVVATIALVISPAARAVSDIPDSRRRIGSAGIASSALTLGIAALAVLRPT